MADSQFDRQLAARIAQANGRLRAGKVGVTIERIKDRLYLRGTFPDRTDGIPHQQRLATGIHANPQGVGAAEKEARRVGALLDAGEFRWADFSRKQQATPPVTIAEWVERFERDYFSRRERNRRSETTWRGDYLKVLRKMPQGEPLTMEGLREFALATPPDTKSRQRTCLVLGALARFAGIPFDAREIAGTYSPRRVTPRDLPTDEAIAAFYRQIPHEGWRWFYGVIATYGLRPHEAFYLDLSLLPVLQVLDGKTGPRRVWPIYPEWADQFAVADRVLPKIRTDLDNSRIGNACGQAMRRYNCPFRLYDLRHCWAIRSLEFGLPIELAAQQMGHSVKIHADCYHHWISDRHHQRAFELLMQRVDRPLPP